MSIKKTVEAHAVACRKARKLDRICPEYHGPCLRSTNLENADLWGTNLENADLRSADLQSANLWGANLGGANLGGTNLENADLRGANLEGANLGSAVLWSANLGGANLWDADLRSANLGGANLWDAVLWSANLGGADLRSANLRGANLRGAVLRSAVLPALHGASDPRALRRRVANHIEASPEQHNQKTWGDPDPSCGTPCCVAGWACRFGGGDHGLTVPTAAVLLLHVDGLPMPSFSPTATREEILRDLREGA